MLRSAYIIRYLIFIRLVYVCHNISKRWPILSFLHATAIDLSRNVCYCFCERQSYICIVKHSLENNNEKTQEGLLPVSRLNKSIVLERD